MRTSQQAGFGMPGFDPAEAVERAQRSWQAWGEALRSVAGSSSGAPASEDLWRDALDRWTQFAGAAMGAPSQRDPLERFTQQARQWFGKMQDVAAQFAGRPAGAEDVAAAWRQAMGGQAENPFAAMFSQMQGRGQSGFDRWYEQVAPFLQRTIFAGAGGDAAQFASRLFGSTRDEARDWLQIPSFGLAREHQERWQALAQAQLDLQEANDGYSNLLAQAGRDAFERFERKLAERSEPGRQLQSARALFDLWIDAAEEAYAEIALSTDFRRRYADLVNAQMRVRAGVQREVEVLGGLFGMPTRTEVDSAHRKVAELERELRRLRKAFEGRSPAANVVSPESTTAKKAVSRAQKSGDGPGRHSVAPIAAKTEAAASKPSRVPSPKPPASKPPASKAPKTAKAKPSRASARPVAKRGARPAIAMSIPEAPQPMTAVAKSSSANAKNRKR
jgi:polyhydroxyalkanoate synthase subunit PhaE